MNDLLSRNEDVDRVINTIRSSRSASFVIDGNWGVGKSFFLDLVNEKIQNESRNETEYEYLVLKYDVWENDYFADPLMGICSTIKEFYIANNAKGRRQKVIRSFLEKAGDVFNELFAFYHGVDIKKVLKKNKEKLFY